LIGLPNYAGERGKANMERRSKFAAWVLLASGLLTSLACSMFSSPGAGQQPAGASGQNNSETPLDNPVTRDGYYFAALQIEDPAPAPTGYRARPGTRLVSVEVIAENQNGDLLSFSPMSLMRLLDTQGTSYNYDITCQVGMKLPDAQLDKGESVQGWITFSLPEQAQPAALEYGYSTQIGALHFQVNLAALMGGNTPAIPIPPADEQTGQGANTSGSLQAQAGLGEIAEAGGCTLSALQVEDPTQSYAPGLYQSLPNTRLMAVEIEVGNTGNAMLTLRDLGLLDSNNTRYGLEFYGRDPSNIFSSTATVDIGQTLRGWISFTIPADAQPASVRLICNSLANPMQNINLQVGLKK
jgi:hypothetical protein